METLAVQTESVATPENQKRAWSPWAIGIIGAFFSFVPAGVMYALNFRRLGQPEKTKPALLYVTLGFFALLGVIFLAPEDWWVSQEFGRVINTSISGVMAFQQRDLFKKYREAGGKKGSVLLPVMASILWVALFMGAMYGVDHLTTTRQTQEINQINTWIELGNYQQAETELLKYIDQFPDEPALYWNLAVVYLRTNQLEQAKETLLTLQKRIPDYTEVEGFLAEVEAMTQAE